MMRHTNPQYWLLICILLSVGCSSARRVTQGQARPTIDYMPYGAAKTPTDQTQDTIIKNDPIISYMGADSNMVYLIPAVWDTVNKENMAMINIAAVTVTGTRVRHVAERKGKINVDFVVAVPKEMQRNNWQTNLYPLLWKSKTEIDSMQAIQLTGAKFRKQQYKAYTKYENYLARTAPNTDYFLNSMASTQGFNQYMDHLSPRHQKLKYLLTLPTRKSDKILLSRFMAFNIINANKDANRTANLAQQQLMLRARKDKTIQYKTKQREPLFYDFKLLNMSKFKPSGMSFNADEGEAWQQVYFEPGAWMASMAWLEKMARVDSVARAAATSSVAAASKTLAAGALDMGLNHIYTPKSESYQNNRYHLGAWVPRPMLNHRDTTAVRLGYDASNYRRRLALESKINSPASSASSAETLVGNSLQNNKVALSKKKLIKKEAAKQRIIPVPLRDGLRLDSVITSRDTLYYKYSQLVTADENTSKLYVYLNGDIIRRGGIFYNMPTSDTLTFNVSSMTNFIDETPYYVRKIITRDAQANSSFYVAFPKNSSELDQTYNNNAQELQKVKDMISKLIQDPIYIIDSISICAYSSPDGSIHTNERFSHKRAQAFGEFMNKELEMWRDSLQIHSSVVMDELGNSKVVDQVQQQYPDLTKSMQISSVAENWNWLTYLIQNDNNIKNQTNILNQIKTIGNPDARETAIRRSFPADFDYIREALYPKLRVVDVAFNLKRRGMLSDTVYTTEIDSLYLEGVRLLRARQYEQAIEILRPYDNVNTALAYMSLGYDAAALRIFSKAKPNADIFYTMAVLYARQNNPGKATQYLIKAVGLNSRLRFRANLDPELSELIKTYNLFPEDDNY